MSPPPWSRQHRGVWTSRYSAATRSSRSRLRRVIPMRYSTHSWRGRARVTVRYPRLNVQTRRWSLERRAARAVPGSFMKSQTSRVATRQFRRPPSNATSMNQHFARNSHAGLAKHILTKSGVAISRQMLLPTWMVTHDAHVRHGGEQKSRTFGPRSKVV